MSSVSSGDYSFEAKHDGRYLYCFSNEHWSANSKEVSFNVHGIVYVPESDSSSDPLEAEGTQMPSLLLSPTFTPKRRIGCDSRPILTLTFYRNSEEIN